MIVDAVPYYIIVGAPFPLENLTEAAVLVFEVIPQALVPVTSVGDMR